MGAAAFRGECEPISEDEASRVRPGFVSVPARTKVPTVEMNPDRKELYGNVPTRTQYTNCTIPVTRTKSRNASTSLSRVLVRSEYVAARRCSAACTFEVDRAEADDILAGYGAASEVAQGEDDEAVCQRSARTFPPLAGPVLHVPAAAMLLAGRVKEGLLCPAPRASPLRC